MIVATRVVLKRRPNGAMSAADFALDKATLPALRDGQFLVKNCYLSLDAGFRQWMNAGASDNYLAEMPLGEPVQSIVLGEVVESRHADFNAGDWVMGRTAWEDYSIADGSDFMTTLTPATDVPLTEYLASLGPSGMTAYFGLLHIGELKANSTVLISAAAGGVGSLAGQICKAHGCTTIGITGSEDKCQWIKSQLGYDIAINHRGEISLDEAISAAAPNGVDLFFDNVGGEILNHGLKHLALNARVVLCGAISQYDTPDRPTGITNLWELTTKRARAEGFMFSDYAAEYPEATAELERWIAAGQLASPLQISQGIDSTASAFCDMLNGRSRGKCLVEL
jgi:NADPH-dependent curcumin reductase CurA